MADRNGYIGRAPSDSAVTVARQTFTPTGVTTDFTFQSGYTPGYFDLFLNGVKMIEGSDFTSSDGSTFSVLGGGASSGDILEAVAYKAFNAVTGIIGVRSEGTVISSNANVINFVGTGNTFALRGDTVDISINAGAAGTWGNFDSNAGITTSKKVRIQNDLQVTGVATAVNFSGNITGTAATFTTVNANLTGDVTGDVTGNADTATLATNAQGLSGTPDITVNNITGVAATFSGAVTVGGVLTYDDVTNVDSIGLVTARSGIEFGSAGVGGTISALGHGEFVGVVTASALDAAISFWTLGADGSNHYTFTGPGDLNGDTDPDLQLIRGQKYVFKNRSGGHPFRIQSTPNGSTGTQYNDGVTNNDAGSGTDLIFDVPFDAPSILYYQCTSHGSMGGPIYIGSSSGDDVNVGAAITMYASSGIVSATSYFGSGANLSGIDASPTFEATADGALTDGMPVIIQADGTVRSAAAAVTQHTITKGSKTSVMNTRFGFPSVIYNKTYDQFFIIAEQQESTDNDTARAFIGTVSDLSVTYNTVSDIEFPVNDCVSASYDIASGYSIAGRVDQSNNVKVTACSHSGTGSSATISKGTTVTVSSSKRSFRLFSTSTATFSVHCDSDTLYVRGFTVASDKTITLGTEYSTSIAVDGNSTSEISMAVATNGSNEALIVYSDDNDGDKGHAIPISLSGTTVTFGTTNEFASHDTKLFQHSVSYDETQDKYLIIYQDEDDGDDCHLVVATVSSSSTVEFGTVNEFEGDNNHSVSTVYDPKGQKHLIVVQNDTSGKYEARKATISGSGTSATVSVDSVVDLENEAYSLGFPGFAYSPDQERFLMVFRQSSNFDSNVLKTATADNKLTAENYIGISNGAYADTETATIQIVGSVDDAQSGLTPGQSYFVKHNGGISVTADDPSVFAGTAVAATKLIVKG